MAKKQTANDQFQDLFVQRLLARQRLAQGNPAEQKAAELQIVVINNQIAALEPQLAAERNAA